MKKKRIFIVDQAGDSQKYGVGKYIYEITEEIKKRKDDYQLISILIGVPKITKIEINEEENISYVKIPKPYRVKIPKLYFNESQIHGLTYLYSIGVFFLLKDFFTFESSDIFHFNSNMQYFILKAVKEYTSSKIFYTIHVSLWKYYYKNDRNLFLSEWNNSENNSRYKEIIKVEVENCMFSDVVICLTSSMERDLVNIYEIPQNKIRRVANGISETKSIMSRKQIDVLKDNLKIQKDNFILLYVGRLNSQKGVSYLLNSFKDIVQNDCKKITLILIGDGIDKPNLISLCKDIRNHIIFTGYIPMKLIEQYYGIADAMVFPSFNEQSSYVMLEGMLNRVPMIVSDIKAFNILENKKSCLKTSLKEDNCITQQMLTNNIKLVINNESLRNKLSNNAYKVFKSNYTSAMMFDKTYFLSDD